MGLANFASLQTIWLFLSAVEVAHFVASFPDRSSELSVASWDDPSTLPQKRRLSFFCSFKRDLCFFFCPRNPPLSTFSFIRFCPEAASHSHLQISFTWRRVHHYWPEAFSKWSRRRQDRGGHGFGGAQAPPPSSFFLPALQMDFSEGTSVCFPGVNA